MSASNTLLLRGGHLLDPLSGESVQENLGVADGMIIPVENVRGGFDTELDVTGQTVIPGLIDAHFHAYAHTIGGPELETRHLSYVAINGMRRLRKALRRGFTTIRDVAGGDLGLQQALEIGEEPACRYLFTGPALSQTGGHGDARPAEYDICLNHGHLGEVVDGIDDIRRAVRERFRIGVHCIKIMASGGVVSPTDPLRIPQYSPEEIAAACDEATRRGSYVAAHTYTADAVIHAVTNGVLSVEHGNLIDTQAAEIMAERGTYLVPTLVAYDAMNRRGDAVGLSTEGKKKNVEVLDAGKHAIQMAAAAGVQIGFGSDLMGDLEDDQLCGIALQAEVQKPLELLRSLTTINAELIGAPELGTLAPGTPADLLILRDDPLIQPQVLWDTTRSRTVIRGGEIVA
ncbi:metal-dependent hydrolase family protein [Nesterenkonia ebinurensis]|uniref:metal-dependent hydrolase family protein n=1 Tax=Nesterenkonia ebinurensis TaxID=2608252 RepID=UPI00123D6D4A|nr:amidohydrolase family protein [Nesterenkonia ebinurensis]